MGVTFCGFCDDNTQEPNRFCEGCKWVLAEETAALEAENARLRRKVEIAEDVITGFRKQLEWWLDRDKHTDIAVQTVVTRLQDMLEQMAAVDREGE